MWPWMARRRSRRRVCTPPRRARRRTTACRTAGSRMPASRQCRTASSPCPGAPISRTCPIRSCMWKTSRPCLNSYFPPPPLIRPFRNDRAATWSTSVPVPSASMESIADPLNWTSPLDLPPLHAPLVNTFSRSLRSYTEHRHVLVPPSLDMPTRNTIITFLTFPAANLRYLSMLNPFGLDSLPSILVFTSTAQVKPSNSNTQSARALGDSGATGSPAFSAAARRLYSPLPPPDANSLSSTFPLTPALGSEHASRSEERRVGKECRSRWSPYH